MFHDDDVTLEPIADQTIAVVGFGSQGHAHAQNLADSGMEVVVGLRSGSASTAAAREAGFEVLAPAEAAAKADILMLLTPDETHGAIWEEEIGEVMGAGKTLLLAHGFSIHYEQIRPPEDLDVAMVAPKGPGHMVRREFTEGRGVPGLIAVAQDPSGGTRDLALAYAKAIGCLRSGVIETSFKDETESDLFGEQAIICGGLSELLHAGFETLVEAGYDERMAYFECVHEAKLIIDLIYERGFVGMRDSISDTAEYGDYSRGSRVIDQDVRAEMKQILREIQAGDFAREWIGENRAGRESFTRMREEQSSHRVEQVSSDLRQNMLGLGAAPAGGAGDGQ